MSWEPGSAPRAAVDAVLAECGRRRVGAIQPVPGSVLNDNYHVDTATGPVFLRFMKERRTREGARAEHRAIAFAAVNGVPAVTPLASPRGETVFSAGGRLAAVFPWVEARPFIRGALTEAGASTLGDVHGRIHAALATYSDDTFPAINVEERWDPASSIADLSRVDDVIRYYPAPGEERLQAQAWLREQLDLLEAGHLSRPPSDFAGLPRQVVHGDIHDGNVLLGSDGAAHVVDWERVGPNVRCFELVRALDFAGATQAPGLAAAWVSGYSRHVHSSAAEIDAAVEMWWQNTLHNTWTFTEVFIRGNAAASRFLPEIVPRLRRLKEPAARDALAATIRAAAGL